MLGGWAQGASWLWSDSGLAVRQTQDAPARAPLGPTPDLANRKGRLGTDARAPHSPIPTVLPADVEVKTPGPLGEQGREGDEHRQGRNREAAPPWRALCRPVHSLRNSHTASRLATSEGTMSHIPLHRGETEAQRGHIWD